MEKFETNSILIVDDDAEALEIYCDLLNQSVAANITSTKYPGEALKLAQKHFFDIVLIDVTMNYQGTQFGGLELYKDLVRRYGDSSLLVYSQYITDDLLRQYDYDFNFIEKGSNPDKFIKNVSNAIRRLKYNQSCFVAMPFSNEFDALYAAIKESVELAGYRCVRVDQQHFTKSIIERVFSEIRNSKLIVFLATDNNPNAFYECGYAVALEKEVITLTDQFQNLPFDIRDRNAIEYGHLNNDFSELKIILSKKVRNLTIPAMR